MMQAPDVISIAIISVGIITVVLNIMVGGTPAVIIFFNSSQHP